MNNADTTISRWISAHPGSLASSDLLSPDDTVGGYVVRKPLGKGLSGEVYEVWHPVLNASFALKIYAPKNDTDAARLLAEVQSLAKVRHPNIVTIHQFGEHKGHPYFIMDLAERLPERLSLAECRKMVSEIGSALEKLHGAGIIHRDIKPQNILLRDHNFLLTDFSIAHAAVTSAHAGLENPTIQDGRRMLVGTHGFIAPEILEGGEPTPSCDQFGLAATCLSLCEAAAENSKTLRVLQRALNAKTELRYASVGDFVSAFHKASTHHRPSHLIALSLLAAAGLSAPFIFRTIHSSGQSSPSQEGQGRMQLTELERELAETKATICARREEILGPYEGIDIFKIKDGAERLRIGGEIADAQTKFIRATFDLQERQAELCRKIERLRER